MTRGVSSQGHSGWGLGCCWKEEKLGSDENTLVVFLFILRFCNFLFFYFCHFRFRFFFVFCLFLLRVTGEVTKPWRLGGRMLLEWKKTLEVGSGETVSLVNLQKKKSQFFTFSVCFNFGCRFFCIFFAFFCVFVFIGSSFRFFVSCYLHDCS